MTKETLEKLLAPFVSKHVLVEYHTKQDTWSDYEDKGLLISFSIDYDYGNDLFRLTLMFNDSDVLVVPIYTDIILVEYLSSTNLYFVSKDSHEDFVSFGIKRRGLAEEEAQEYLLNVFNGILSALDIKENQLNKRLFLDEDQVQKILELEYKFPELTIRYDKENHKYSISTFSLLSTMSKILCGKYISFEVDDGTNKIVKAEYFREGTK